MKQDGGYTDDQIFNVDETALLWKQLIKRSYVLNSQQTFSGYKTAKERLTFLLGGNASGTLKLRPLAIHRFENPRCFKNIEKSGLPVIWKANKKAWMTQQLFRDWFHNYFCPEVKLFCRVKNIDFKILLLLDNAGGHPTDLNHPNVKIVYLPPNTTSILQPMDMGIIANFKAVYLQETFDQASLATDPVNPKRIELPAFWKQYNVYDAIQNASKAWNSIKDSTLRSMWNKVMPEREEIQNDNNAGGEAETEAVEHMKIVNLGKNLNIKEFCLEDVQNFIGPMGAALNDEELDEMDTAQADDTKESDNEESETENEEKPLDLGKIKEGMDHVKKAIEIFGECDPDVTRRFGINNTLKGSIKPYEELMAQMKPKRQSKIDNFFSRN